MFARLRSPSIRASLYALFGTMLLLLAGMLGASMLEASRAKDAAEHVVDLARANRDAFTALKSFRTERGAMGYLLTLKDAIDDNQLSYYRAVRAERDSRQGACRNRRPHRHRAASHLIGADGGNADGGSLHRRAGRHQGCRLSLARCGAGREGP